MLCPSAGRRGPRSAVNSSGRRFHLHRPTRRLLKKAPRCLCHPRMRAAYHLVTLRFNSPERSDTWVALALSISSWKRSPDTSIPGSDYSEAKSDTSPPRSRLSTSRWRVCSGHGEPTRTSWRASSRRPCSSVSSLTRPAIETNLVVNTDRRTYLIELRSREKPYMPSVAWFYPEDRTGRSKMLPLTPIIPEVDQRRYRYVIEGDSPPWRPVNAYDDGRKAYIEFSPGISQGEMPPLFVIGQDGKPELVNYRAYRNVLIVDRLFAAAELRLGGEHQQKVRIVRTDGRPSS